MANDKNANQRKINNSLDLLDRQVNDLYRTTYSTTNTSEELKPSVLSYFAVYKEDGSRCPGTSVRAQLTAARADEKAFFADGIKPGETAESDVYIEIPRNFEKLTFSYCPDTVDPSTGYAALSFITTFTADDIKPAE